MSTTTEMIAAPAAAQEAPSKGDRPKPNGLYVPEFDGIRGLAAVLVVFFHYLSLSRFASPWIYYSAEVLYRIPLSVDAFFILSGFLIGTILLNNQKASNYYKVFYMRRTYRILPLYYAWFGLFVLLFFLTPGWGILHPANYSSASIMVIYATMLQNNFVRIFDGSIWMGTSWTLGVEEPFYVLAPLCYRIKSKKAMVWLFGGTVVAASVFRALIYGYFAHGAKWGADIAYFWTFSRIGTPALGCLMAVAWDEPKVKEWCKRNVWLFYTGMIVLPIVSYLAAQAAHMSFRHSFLVNILFERDTLVFGSACLVVVCLAHSAGRLAGMMRWRWLAHFGSISYGLYLMHYGIFWFIYRFVLHQEFNANTFLAVKVMPFAFLISWGIAELSWKYFEKPLVRRGQAYRYITPETAAEPAAKEPASRRPLVPLPSPEPSEASQ